MSQTAGVTGNLLASYVPAYVYDSHLEPGGSICMGNGCWSASMLFFIVSCTISALTGTILTCRTAGLYRALAATGNGVGEGTINPVDGRMTEAEGRERAFDDYRRSRSASTAADDYRRE